MKQFLNITLQKILPQQLLTCLAGKLANCKIRLIKNFLIDWFIKKYQVDLSEANETNAHNFPDFNSFFTRELKMGVRQIDLDSNSIVSPVDGTVSRIGAIKADTIIQAKKFDYSLRQLVGEKIIADNFVNGNFATLYLSPSNYHRVHMPLTGKLQRMIYIPGDLFSVNAMTANNIPNLFARNERVVAIFDTTCGLMAMIFIGALIVGSIETVWSGVVTGKTKEVTQWNYSDKNITLKKGAEAGRFKLGSTVILLFQQNVMRWEALHINEPVKVGMKIGNVQ